MNIFFEIKYQIYFDSFLAVLSFEQMSFDNKPLRKRGPPPTGKGWLVGVRLQPAQLQALDAWIANQPNKISRPEAVRRILTNTLGDERLAPRVGGSP